jgi:hypothetical protein
MCGVLREERREDAAFVLLSFMVKASGDQKSLSLLVKGGWRKDKSATRGTCLSKGVDGNERSQAVNLAGSTRIYQEPTATARHQKSVQARPRPARESYKKQSQRSAGFSAPIDALSILPVSGRW